MGSQTWNQKTVQMLDYIWFCYGVNKKKHDLDLNFFKSKLFNMIYVLKVDCDKIVGTW